MDGDSDAKARPKTVRSPLRVGYVLKMFPRLSETFVLNEILELERQGSLVSITSLRKPDDGRFHPALGDLRAAVEYAPEWKIAAAWSSLKGSPLRAPRYRARLGRTVARLLSLDVSEPWLRLSEGLALAERAIAARIRHIHAHFATSATEVAMIASGLTGIPYSFTAHAKDVYRETVSPALFSEKARTARFVVTVTRAAADFVRARLLSRDPGLGKKIRLLHNGVDLDRFRPAPNADPAGAAPLVLSVGRLVEKKGFPVLLEACAALKKKRVPFRCEIAGDGEERAALESRARSLGLGPSVTFLGALTHDEVRERLGQAALVALPCVVGADGNRDSLPTVLLEAMACGLPVVSTRVGGIPEIVDPGRNGLLVPESDPKALATAIEALASDPARRKKLGAAAREKAEARFDLRRNVAVLRGWFARSTSPSRAAAGAPR